jgi:hypothetical protein
MMAVEPLFSSLTCSPLVSKPSKVCHVIDSGQPEDQRVICSHDQSVLIGQPALT